MRLTNWTARRAGGRITVTGTNEEGKDAKIVGVDKIVLDPDGECKHAVFAVDKTGAVHILAL